MALTQRLFPNVSELQGRVDGVGATPRRRDAVFMIIRRVVPRRLLDGRVDARETL